MSIQEEVIEAIPNGGVPLVGLYERLAHRDRGAVECAVIGLKRSGRVKEILGVVSVAGRHHLNSTSGTTTKTTQVCERCNIERSLAEFQRTTNGSHALVCKRCHGEAVSRARRKADTAEIKAIENEQDGVMPAYVVGPARSTAQGLDALKAQARVLLKQCTSVQGALEQTVKALTRLIEEA